MKLVRARLRHDVDDRAAGAAVFGRVGVGVHLELFHGVLRELIRRAAGAGAADGLAEEVLSLFAPSTTSELSVPRWPAKLMSPSAHVANDAGSGEHEVDEVAAVRRKVLNRLLITTELTSDLVVSTTGAAAVTVTVSATPWFILKLKPGRCRR